MVAAGITVVDIAINTGYTELYFETTVPFETAAQDETEAQHVQYLFSPQYSLDRYLPSSL